MSTKFVIVLFASSLLLLPIVIQSLLTGSKAPENSWMAKYFAAEKYLGLTGNLFLLTVCGSSLARLARHLGLIDLNPSDRVALLVAVPFLLLLVLYLGLWVRAAVRVRRSANSEMRP